MQLLPVIIPTLIEIFLEELWQRTLPKPPCCSLATQNISEEPFNESGPDFTHNASAIGTLSDMSSEKYS